VNCVEHRPKQFAFEFKAATAVPAVARAGCVPITNRNVKSVSRGAWVKRPRKYFKPSRLHPRICFSNAAMRLAISVGANNSGQRRRHRLDPRFRSGKN